ncbi:type IV secretory system conjugative DNA transfer family protein [Rhizobium sp. BK176]|uniref:type IV secretory system conjugative DNA transfer family protein n=1 Tax=Rhizobium sp. BK176 TaxID=2587071 RepID=UPI00216A474A|nr:type IV secretory system conjugative DNA transfer family protein [Rhizobium sp. BK176]MCS4096097.1 type IV secretion system protein VirD4 [Rhizobium sp. BK176]
MSRSYLITYFCFCLLIAVAIWMLSYSLILQIVWRDGRILRLMTTTDPLAPMRQFIAYADNRSLQFVALASLLPAIAAGACSAALGLRRPTNPLGDAAFQDVASLRRAGWFRRDGHIFGRLGGRILRRKDDRHHLIIGPTRSGKGVGYVIPNALMFEGSMIVSDLKGEIFERTAAYRKARGNQVFLFSPGASRTHRWNPLDFVRADRGERTIDIQNMAAILIPESAGSDNAVWQGLAQQVIAGVISYVLESRHYRNRRNLGEVNAFFNTGEDLQVLMKSLKEKEKDLSRFTLSSFNAYIALNERAARSALLDIQKALAPFRNERVVAATAVTDMNIVSLQRRPVTIYLAPNITDMTILRPLLTLFVQQLMDLLTRDHDPNAVPVYFLLDEFRQLKRMDEVLNKLPYIAGYNIKMAFIVQDLKSIDEIYGETTRHSLLGNCGLQLILGANDQATAEYASRSLGKRTIRYQSETRTIERLGLPRRTRVEQIRERDLMMPQEIRQMPEDRAILLVEGQKPILAGKLRYHAVEPFKSAAAHGTYASVEIPEIDLPPNSTVPDMVADREELATDLQQEQGPVVDEPVPAPVVIAEAVNDETSVASARSRSVVTAGSPGSEARLSMTALRLDAIVARTLRDTALTAEQRVSIQEILANTVPDPTDVGLESVDDDVS